MSTLATRQSRRKIASSEFRPDVFLIATAVAAAILLSIVLIPQQLSKQTRWEVLRMHVGQIGQLAVSTVDGDLHHRLLDPSNYSADLYKSALEPLVRFHSANADLFYVYTMAVRDGLPRFILDTAASSDLRTQHKLRASGYMQPFNPRQIPAWVARSDCQGQDLRHSDLRARRLRLFPHGPRADLRQPKSI
jgi:hypothetical protein